MAPPADGAPLPLARPLPAGRTIDRAELRLGDGYVTSVWVHPAAPGAAGLPVLYVHGIQSHPGWFSGSAVALAEAGHAVFQPVRRGSGDNLAARGDAPSARQLLDDVDAAAAFVRERTGAERMHLVGVSWGGKLLAAWAASRARPEAASLVLVAPGIAPRVDLTVLRKLAVAWALLVRPDRLFDIPLNDPALFTDDEAMQDYLWSDSFRLRQATARFLRTSRTLDGMIRRAPRGTISAPTALILAEDDRIIRNAATAHVVDRLTAGRMEVRILPGVHTLEFQTGPAEYFRTLVQAVGRRDPDVSSNARTPSRAS